MSRDCHNNMKYSRALSPVAAVTNDTAFVSEILDTADFAANELVLIAGSIADADVTFTVLLEEGDASNLSDNAAVADANLLGTESGATFLFSSDNKTAKLGYKGTKRYIRATVTPANNSGDIFLAGIWAQGAPRNAGLTTQIV